jgi:hypothetical protein
MAKQRKQIQDLRREYVQSRTRYHEGGEKRIKGLISYGAYLALVNDYHRTGKALAAATRKAPR